MPVEIFNQKQFEEALPTKGGKPIWECLGLVDGEYAYLIPCTNGNGVGIHIRSSIDSTGFSAECGENSIRAWIVDAAQSRKGDNRPLGNKVQRWTTREKGWQRRLWNLAAPNEKDRGLLYQLGKMASQIGPCPICGTRTKVFRVKKEGPNKGRAFLNCPNNCKDESGRKYFVWLDDIENAKQEPAVVKQESAKEPAVVVKQESAVKMFKLSVTLNADQLMGVKALLKAQQLTPVVEEVTVCPKCGKGTLFVKVQQGGDNQGRSYCLCTEECGFCQWVD